MELFLFAYSCHFVNAFTLIAATNIPSRLRFASVAKDECHTGKNWLLLRRQGIELCERLICRSSSLHCLVRHCQIVTFLFCLYFLRCCRCRCFQLVHIHIIFCTSQKRLPFSLVNWRSRNLLSFTWMFQSHESYRTESSLSLDDQRF